MWNTFQKDIFKIQIIYSEWRQNKHWGCFREEQCSMCFQFKSKYRIILMTGVKVSNSLSDLSACPIHGVTTADIKAGEGTGVKEKWLDVKREIINVYMYTHIFSCFWGMSFTNEPGCHAQGPTVILQCTSLISDVENMTWDHNFSIRGGLSSPRKLLFHEQTGSLERADLSFQSGDYTVVPLIQHLLFVECWLKHSQKSGRWLRSARTTFQCMA